MAVLASDLRLALDPVAFAMSCGIEPDPWQADVLRSQSPRLLLNCSRQSGKSSTVALLAVHAAIYQPASLTLVLSPTLRQSQETFRKCLDVYQAAGAPVPSDAENRLSLELTNGARIVSLPGKEGTIRGYSGVSLLLIDEASRVGNGLYASARPMLAVSGGRLIAPSTPFGTRGWWYDAWAKGAADWERIEIPATACPRISAAFLDEERRTLGEWWFDQEYLCRFLDAETQAFRRADIDAAFSEGIEAWTL